MSLLTTIKNQLTDAIKSSNVVAKSALRVLLGRIQTSGKEDDESVISAVKSLIKQNQEEIQTRNGQVLMPDGTIKTVEVSGQEADIAKLNAENEILKAFLPSYLSEEEINTLLTGIADQIKQAKNEGAAIGMAMKFLAKENVKVEGQTVKSVVQKMR